MFVHINVELTILLRNRSHMQVFSLDGSYITVCPRGARSRMAPSKVSVSFFIFLKEKIKCRINFV